MRRTTISLLLSLALMLSAPWLLGCETAPAQSGEGEAALACETEEDWENGLHRVRMVYENISPSELQEIIDKYVSRGLRLLPSTAEGWGKILYGDGLWVEISDNTKSYHKCVITETWGRSTADEQALSVEEAGALIPVEAVHLLERTPEGLYEATGTQVFCLLADCPPEEGIVDPLYQTDTWLVGKEQAIPLHYCFYGEGLACTDVDDDGKGEIVLLGYGPTSGIFTETIAVYGVSDGSPWLRGRSFYWMKWGETDLVQEKGELCFSYGSRSYPIRLRNGWIELEGALEEEFELWGGAYYKRPDLPADTVLKLCLWEEGGELMGFLWDDRGRDLTPSECNAMAPWPADTLVQILLENRERPLQVYWAERPAREPPRELTGFEREAILTRLGVD